MHIYSYANLIRSRSPSPTAKHVCRKSNRLMMHLAHEIFQCSHAGSLTAANLRANGHCSVPAHSHNRRLWPIKVKVLIKCSGIHAWPHPQASSTHTRLYLHAHLVILTVGNTYTDSRILNQHPYSHTYHTNDAK